MSTFSRFAPRLQQAIVANLGWTRLRPVQEEAGAALLDGDNAVVLAPTAGGKTEAAFFPLLSTLVSDPPVGLAAIYIAPIKALLNNQAERLGRYTEMVGLRRMVWHGDVGAPARRQFLREPTELLMTTPESIEVMLVSERVDAAALFGGLRWVVIDEIHALGGTDRGAHLMSVLERLARFSRHDVQRVGLSATVGNPPALLGWLQGSSGRPSRVVDPPKTPGRRQLLVTHRQTLDGLAEDAARLAKGGKSLLFCQSRSTTEAVAAQMRRLGTEVFVHHSAVSKEERALAEHRFHHGTDACIVATSTLELGIDVGDLDRVLQIDAPATVSSFLQRMGRTGRRAGQSANTTFLCESDEAVLQAVSVIDLARSGWVESVALTDRCWPVLVHQLLAMALAEGGIPAEAAWAHLSRVPDLKGIHRAEFDRLIAWMLRDGSLVLATGRLLLGPKAERRFGRRNFMELFAVFCSPQSYTVLDKGASPVGTLSQAFVDGMVEGVSCFLLGGRAWVVQRLDHGARELRVEPAPRGRMPTWGGFLPQFLGMEVCQAALRALTDTQERPYLHPSARQRLEAKRAAMEGLLEPGVGGLEVDEGELRWWTFAGGRINGTLRHALLAVGGDWKIIPDNYLLRIQGEGLDRRTFDEALARLAEPELWENDRLWAEVAAGLPAYRLSKFQPLLPDWVQREMIATYLLDLGGAWRWLGGERALRRAIVVEAAGETVTAGPSPVRRAVHWVDTAAGLAEACAALEEAGRIGLDVETTLHSQALCLVQVASAEAVYLFDALELSDLGPLAAIFGDREIEKVIHNAAFERSVLGRLGMELVGVIDTLALSRARRGAVEGGHSLAAVCARELGLILDKGEQTSDWTRRPLTPAQLAYAALDADVLLPLAEVLGV